MNEWIRIVALTVGWVYFIYYLWDRWAHLPQDRDKSQPDTSVFIGRRPTPQSGERYAK